jgi:hypothetical protein
MTCEICVMNRHAAVLAADSASTVSRWVDGRLETRYFKGANKIFQLSHHQPVGVMIFNASELLHVPWEILIKSFRDELAAKTFSNLDGYAEEFFRFLDANAKFFPEQVQRDETIAAVQRAAIQLLLGVDQELNKLKDADTLAKVKASIDSRKAWLDQTEIPKRVTAEHAQRAITTYLGPVGEGLAFLELPDDLRQALAEYAVNHVVKRPGDFLGTAGLVFAGFGDHDIFPHMIEYQSSGMLDGTQIIAEVSRAAADHTLPATLNAFAQTSMSDTFTIGFSEDVYNALMEGLNERLREFAARICTEAKIDIASLNLDPILGEARKHISEAWFERARREHSYPLRRVLGDLPVEEMAELAETLVNLQSLKEKVTKPSASVGGPVDVAIITKAEGLVWVKRKLFFDPDLNPRYHYRQQAKHQ